MIFFRQQEEVIAVPSMGEKRLGTTGHADFETGVLQGARQAREGGPVRLHGHEENFTRQHPDMVGYTVDGACSGNQGNSIFRRPNMRCTNNILALIS